MYKENTIEFKTSQEHGQWVSSNRILGLREIDCQIENEIIKVTYINVRE